MDSIIIGIDPDSKAHGVAMYKDGKLAIVTTMPLMALIDLVHRLRHRNPVVHIEDVNGVSAAFRARSKQKDGIAVQLKMAQHIGMCKQAQIEVERMCEYLGVGVVKHKISKQWKCPASGKPMFERITGWTGRSNEDSRSAAYFGWLGVTSKATTKQANTKV